MTDLPRPLPGQKKLGLVIDLDLCVGCHACATACKEWNTGGHMGPLPDFNAYENGAWGVWFNRIHSFEDGTGDGARTVHFPKSCLHCEDAACVMVCPTKARFFGDLGDPNSVVSDLVASRSGKDLMPELGYRPVNKYLPPSRNRLAPDVAAGLGAAGAEPEPVTPTSGLLRWVDRLLSR
jgi:Fe-S-cluster-containing dehydrogenase component